MTPKIDKRNYENLLEEMKASIPDFLPERWQPADGSPDLALIKIYAHMAEEVINRLNEVPQKHFTAFLDMLGISLLPADAAKAPVTFFLSEGAVNHVLIPKGTPVAAGEKDVVFETQRNMLATPARSIYTVPVDDAIYLGFDKKIQKGPVSIYFSLEQQGHNVGGLSKLIIYYWTAEGQWKPLKIADHTRSMSENGTVELFVPLDFVKSSIPYGEELEDLYWLKAETGGIAGIGDRLETPVIKAVHVNTVMVAQVEHIENEVIGSSDGSAGQEFFLRRTPVISEEIYVDETGKDTETPVRWQAKDDFLDSSSKCRHYVIDRTRGSVSFGNGIQGMIPQAGRDNIKASYQTGGGSNGNVDAFEIKDLKTSIPCYS